MKEIYEIIEDKIESFKDNTEVFAIYELDYIEDYYETENDILITESEQVAQNIVNELNSIAIQLEKEKDIFRNFRNKWYSNNKFVEEPLVKIPPLSDRPKGTDITQEMLTKYRLLTEKNTRISKRNRELYLEHEKLLYFQYNEFAKSEGLTYTTEQIMNGTDAYKFGYRKINKVKTQ